MAGEDRRGRTQDDAAAAHGRAEADAATSRDAVNEPRRPRVEHGALPAPTKEHLDDCRRCDLWEHATQGVPGEGPTGAKIMLVGEQPGNEEDLEGVPFVGPAGRMLRTLLDEAGIDAGRVYMTNAVKHFSFVLRGKRRIHKTPLQRQVSACHVWLESELVREKPAVIVALGATALAAIARRRISITFASDRVVARTPVKISRASVRDATN
jgi:DNA polymerase